MSEEKTKTPVESKPVTSAPAAGTVFTNEGSKGSSAKEWYKEPRLIVFAIALLIGGLYLGYTYMFQVQDKVVSVVNNYESDVDLSINGQEYTLASGRSQDYRLENVQDEISVVAKVAEEVVYNTKHQVDRKSGISLHILTTNPEVDAKCIYTGNVQALYYDVGASSAKEISIVTTEASTDYYHDLGQFLKLDDKFVYPGAYDGIALPDEISQSDDIYGFYALDCGLSEADAAIEMARFGY